MDPGGLGAALADPNYGVNLDVVRSACQGQRTPSAHEAAVIKSLPPAERHRYQREEKFRAERAARILDGDVSRQLLELRFSVKVKDLAGNIIRAQGATRVRA